MWNPLQFQAKEEKVQVADDSLSKADPLNEWHPLSEAYNSLSRLGNPKKERVKDVLAQRAASQPSEDVVSSRAQCTQSY